VGFISFGLPINGGDRRHVAADGARQPEDRRRCRISTDR
jgi:hypothetical protein